MTFFNNLFAAYYFLCLKLRKINRTRIEDFQAMCLVLCSQILLVAVLMTISKKIYHLTFIIPELSTIIIALLLLFIGHKYFLSNRIRKNLMIDTFRNFPNRTKIVWKIIAVCLILLPLLYIIFLT